MTFLNRNTIKKSVTSDFIKHTSTLVSGTALAQLIPILIQPVLRRYYAADLFGTYAVYMSLIGILYGIASLRYEQAIVLPKSDKDAMNIMGLSQIINIIFSSLLFVTILCFHSTVAVFFNIPVKYIVFLWVVPIGVLLFNLHQTINLWLIRKKSFLSVSVTKIARRGSEGLFQLIFRYLKISNGLILGDLIGHIANNIYGVYQAFKKGFRLSYVKLSEIKKVAKTYSDYPKYNAFTTLLNASSLLLPVLIINKYYGAENAGYYDLARLILLTPIVLLATSISNVMLQRIAEKKRLKQFFAKEILLILSIGFLIAFVEIAIILPFGERLFSFVFGAEWAFSGKLSTVLIWPYLLYFFTASLNSFFLALQKIKQLSIYQTINFLLIVTLFFFKNLEFYSFIKAFVLIYMGSSLIFFAFLSNVIIDYKKSITK